MEEYEYDDFLFTALLHKSKPIVFENFKSIISTLYKISNHSFTVDYEIDINEIELKLKNTFIEKEEELGDDLIEVMSKILIKDIVKYFYLYGITISTDIKLSELDSILNSFLILLNVDQDLTSLYVDIIDTDEYNNTESFVEILNSFNVIKDERCYEIILDVHYSFIDTLKEYLLNIQNTKVEDDEMLNRLLTLDGKYRNTEIVKNYLRDGYEDVSIETNIDNMYKYIEKQSIDIIPYEVVATHVLSFDTRLDLENSISKYFNIEILNLQPLEIETINNKIESLVYEIDKRL